MQWFFARISTKFYPVYFGYRFKKDHNNDFDILNQQKIITHSSNIDEIECDLCDESHTTLIRQDGSRLFIVCENGCGVRDVQSEELAIYEYQTTQLLSLFLSSLGMRQANISENVIGLLWNLGSHKFDDTEYQMFFSNDIDKIDSGHLSIINAFPNTILFYTGVPRRTLPQLICTIPFLETIQKITKKVVSIDKEKIFLHVRSHTRHVLFHNGDIIINGEKLGHIPLSTADYFFVERLWQKFNIPVSHDDLFTYCKEKLKKNDYTDTAQKFCNKRMSSIRKILGNKEKVDSIFISEKTKSGSNGYKMKSP
jgi:hypothetical protein